MPEAPSTGHRSRLIASTLTVLGVGLFSTVAWRRTLASAGDADGRVVVAAVLSTLLVVGLGTWWVLRGDQDRVAAVRREGVRSRDGACHAVAVRSDASLSAELVQHGLWEPRLRPDGGTPLVLAWSAQGVTLWRGRYRPRKVADLPWAWIASVTTAPGSRGGRPYPCVFIETLAGTRLGLHHPANRPRGTWDASAPADRLAAQVRETRDLASA